MSTTPRNTVRSPCIGQCWRINREVELCGGCYRTIDEIQRWWKMDPEEKSKALEKCEKRRYNANLYDNKQEKR